MSQADRFVYRNRVNECTATAIAVVAGVAAASAGAQPTGAVIVDWPMVACFVGVVVWASASAPWWAPSLASGVGAVIAFDPVVALVGTVGFVGGLVIGVRQRDQSELRALVGAIAMNVLIRSQLDGFLGLSAIIGIGFGVALFVAGVRRRPSAIRRTAWIAGAAVLGFGVVALLGLAVGGLAARPDLSRGSSLASQAIDALNSGDYEAASLQFSRASEAFDSAERRLDGVITLPSRLVPGAAQNARRRARSWQPRPPLGQPPRPRHSERSTRRP